MAGESGVAANAARRGTQKAVKSRLQRVQETIGRLAGRAAAGGKASAARMKQLMGRFGKANTAAENTLNARESLKARNK